MPVEHIRLLSSRDAGLSPDLSLAADLYLPPLSSTCPEEVSKQPSTAPGLVVGHGAGSQAARHEEFCLEACRQGFAVLALDFRGHGRSEGVADGPLEHDVLAAVAFLRSHPLVHPDSICYRGSSMGGFYGLKAAAQANFAAMALLCPASEEVMLEALSDPPATTGGSSPPAAATARWDRLRLQAYFERQDSRVLAAQVRCPVLLVHARPDTQVPFSHSLLLTRHLRTDTTLLALAKGSHTSAQHDPAVHSYTLAWLRRRVL